MTNIKIFALLNHPHSFLYSFLWHIPLTYKTDTSSTVQRHLMTTQTGNREEMQTICHKYLYVCFAVTLFSILFCYFCVFQTVYI